MNLFNLHSDSPISCLHFVIMKEAFWAILTGVWRKRIWLVIVLKKSTDMPVIDWLHCSTLQKHIENRNLWNYAKSNIHLSIWQICFVNILLLQLQLMVLFGYVQFEGASHMLAGQNYFISLFALSTLYREKKCNKYKNSLEDITYCLTLANVNFLLGLNFILSF